MNEELKLWKANLLRRYKELEEKLDAIKEKRNKSGHNDASR